MKVRGRGGVRNAGVDQAIFLSMTVFENPGSRPVGCSSRGCDYLIQPCRPRKKNVRCQAHRCPVCLRYFYTNHEFQTFCSVTCWLIFRREHSRRARCPVCTREFNPRPTGRGGVQRCCSRRCAGFFARGPGNVHWKNGRYALPVPTEIQPAALLTKRRMRQKRRLRTPAQRGRFSHEDIDALIRAKEAQSPPVVPTQLGATDEQP